MFDIFPSDQPQFSTQPVSTTKMAESTVSIIVGLILGKIRYAAEWISDDDGELSGLEATIASIKALTVDAEEKQADNPRIKTWLKRLEGVVYEADDLMDVVYN